MVKKLISKSLIFNYNNFLIFIISLVPAAIVAGPLLADLFISIIGLQYIFNIIYRKKFFLLKANLFIFFFIFYLYLLINTFIFSDIYNEVWINVLFYFRFFIFVYASSDILNKNYDKLIFIYFVFIATIFTVLVDGYVQFIFGENLIGYQKLRPDRISGFFGDDLVLGSFLFKMTPVILYFSFIYKKEKLFFITNCICLILTIILIFLTGERSSFFLLLIFLSIFLVLIKIELITKASLAFSFILMLGIIQLINPTILDRYFTQTAKQLISKDKIILPYYMPLFETALKISNSNKFLGLGPKSFRYYCDKSEYISYSPNFKIINNSELLIDLGWKKNNKPLKITKQYIKVGDVIKHGDLIFNYKFENSSRILKYYSDKAGKVLKLDLEKDLFWNGNRIANLDPSIFNIPVYSKRKISGCSTHPHNFYLQLLSEIGYIGFLFIFGLFIFISFKILKNLALIFMNKYNNPREIIFLSFYFSILFPFSTSGNFFNNWLNIVTFYPLIFYFVDKNLDINVRKNKK